jgi:hypothetical protein
MEGTSIPSKKTTYSSSRDYESHHAVHRKSLSLVKPDLLFTNARPIYTLYLIT